ncbi:MAG: efflux RND transporter permease subunit [Candidatus Dojkabacteria bacterium]|nr:MAG: efflux RND transporter permease subunit [Candidatus Dojkabacteria bacterium]
MKDNIITKVSLFFVNRSRFTILITLSLLAMGFYTYTNTLKKEGFPVINIPYIVVVTPYLSGDPAKTEADITIPIYDTVLELEEVEEINSSSSANVSTVVITLDQDNSDPYKVEELVAERVESLNLPNESQISIPEPGLVDGENDILISIYSDELGLEELQERGELLATEIERNDMVQHANVKEQFVETYDFGQNREVVVQNSFSRLITVEGNGSRAFEKRAFDTIVIGIMKKNQDIGTLDFSESVRRQRGEGTRKRGAQRY